MPGTPERYDPNMPDKKTAEVNNEWFNAHFYGNRLFPQKMRVIRLFTTSEIILNPPANGDFSKLRNSKLNNKQTGKLAEIMNRLHERTGVVKFTPESRELLAIKKKGKVGKSAEVELSRYNELWESGVDGALRMIAQRTVGGPPLPSIETVNKGSVQMISEEEVAEITAFWQNPKNNRRIMEITEGTKRIWDLLNERTPDNKSFTESISKLWIKALTPKKQNSNPPKDDKYPISDELFAAYQLPEVRTFVAERYGSKRQPASRAYFEGSKSSEILAFFNEVEHLGKNPTETNADQDVIYKIFKFAIESKCEELQIQPPFGLEYEGLNTKPAV